VLLFPLLPLAWEAWSARRFSKKSAMAKEKKREPPRRLLAFSDRLIFRTLLINCAFLAAIAATFPKVAFTALATRGDWFLDGRNDPTSESIRRATFAAANALEWLHELANPNPYKLDEQEQQHDVDPTPTDPTPPKPVQSDDATWVVGDTRWPHAETVHPLVDNVPPEAEQSIQALGKYFAAHEPDPFLRVKALHDWVVTRLSYDVESTRPGKRKPQDPHTVFATRQAVCEGYARLLVALGQASGDRVAYVVGEVREDDGSAAPVGHAWNAVQIKQHWYIIDATWDDPISDDGKHIYRTDYLFIPPSIAVLDHLPDDPRYQLLEKPLTRGEFLRQPFARPGFARLGLKLKQPERPLVDARGSLEILVDNPRGLYIMAENCGEPSNASVAKAVCHFPDKGRYRVSLFANKERNGTYEWVGNIGVTSL
jgi:transglutaminase-like putative cysteine protease